MIQDRLRAFGGAILLHQIQSRERDVELRALGILEQHELGVAVALVDLFQSLILPNSVLHVNNVVADLQIAEIREKCRGLRFLPLRPRHDRVRFVERSRVPKTASAASGKIIPSGT